MIKVYAKRDCGCCTVEMQFESFSKARRVFAQVGYGNGMEVKDDTGEVHKGIDTFFGFSENEDRQREKSLGYLAELLDPKC